MPKTIVSPQDREILRQLAGQVRQIAELPEMAQRRQRWYDHNALRPQRPLVLCFPEGAWDELCPPEVCQCQDPMLRGWELDLRRRIYWWEHIHDDHTMEPTFAIWWKVDDGDFGVKVERRHGANRGSFVWTAPIQDLEKDMAKLRFRQPKLDREGTMANLEMARELFGDLLECQLAGGVGWTMGLTIHVIDLIGLERLMLAMMDEPENLHRLMAWMRDEHLHYIQWRQDNGLLSMNNANGYTGSGGVAYTHELPQRDWKAGQAVRLKDLWGFAESQETVGVSPTMFNEFILPYQLPLLEKFGLNCYGCCEPIHLRWPYIKQIPRLRRVSVSPWCDQEKMAEYMGGKYIFSRKPNPALVCASTDEGAIRDDLRKTLQIAGKLPLELVLKDTHTVQHQPQRLTRWVQIALEEVERCAG